MKAGEIYYTEQPGTYIFRAKDEKGGYIGYINLDNNAMFTSSKGDYDWKDYREATYEEKQWFVKCEKAGKLVEKPKLLHYEIY